MLNPLGVLSSSIEKFSNRFVIILGIIQRKCFRYFGPKRLKSMLVCRRIEMQPVQC